MNINAIQALQLSLVVVSIVFAGANYLAWRLFGHPRHALIWTAAYLLAAAQYILNLVREQLPSYECYWLTVNAASYLLVISAVWGHRQRLGQITAWPAVVALFGLLMLVQLVFTLLIPRMDIRVALAPGFACLAMVHIAWLLLRHGPEPVLAQRVAAAVHFLFGLAQGAAAVIALQFGVEASEEMRDAYHLINFALMPTFFVAMGVAVMFLLATDLATQLRLLAVTDQLTGVANRRGFLVASEQLLARARRRSQPLTLVLVDIDLFKRINDRYGHVVGDRALAHFASVLRHCVRSEDTIGRIGGEEFAILSESSVADAERMVMRIRQTLLEQPLQEGSQQVVLTASFGIAQWLGGRDVEALMMAADEALYRAKDAGRDSVIIAGKPQPAGVESVADGWIAG